jgi:hypothetical protein
MGTQDDRRAYEDLLPDTSTLAEEASDHTQFNLDDEDDPPHGVGLVGNGGLTGHYRVDSVEDATAQQAEQLPQEQDAQARREHERQQEDKLTDLEWQRQRWEAEQLSRQQEEQRAERQRAEQLRQEQDAQARREYERQQQAHPARNIRAAALSPTNRQEPLTADPKFAMGRPPTTAREMDWELGLRQVLNQEALQRQEQARRTELEFKLARSNNRAESIRSMVLLLVVLAVILYPLYAMIADETPAAFSQFIAPITAIAGTIIGYWFGSRTERATSSLPGDQPSSVITPERRPGKTDPP